jgi:hypothetical protein
LNKAIPLFQRYIYNKNDSCLPPLPTAPPTTTGRTTIELTTAETTTWGGPSYGGTNDGYSTNINGETSTIEYGTTNDISSSEGTTSDDYLTGTSEQTTTQTTKKPQITVNANRRYQHPTSTMMLLRKLKLKPCYRYI